jgi:hypothetical protein
MFDIQFYIFSVMQLILVNFLIFKNVRILSVNKWFRM